MIVGRRVAIIGQGRRHHGLFLAKPFCREQLSTAIAATLLLPLLSGEVMWHGGMAGVGGAPPVRPAHWSAKPL